jgi:serine/threonine-protein kinase
VDLAELSSWPMGAWWTPGGNLLLGSEREGVRRVPAEGGPAQEITTVDRSRESGHRLPSPLPGGRTLVVSTIPLTFGVEARVEVVSLTNGERKVVVENGADGQYLPTGHLVFVRQGVLMAAPFDLRRLELAAPPVPVVEGVAQALNLIASFRNSGAAQFALSDSGLLAYGSGGVPEDAPTELLVVDTSGRARPLPGFDRPLVYPDFRFSPDGRQLAFTERPRSGRLWLFDVERQTYRLLSDRGQASSPRWSPDGTRLLVSWTDGGPFHLSILPLDGGDWERLTEGEHHDWAPSSWGPDGRHLGFARWVQSSLDVLLYRFEDRQVTPFLTTPAQESHPEISPDGRWLAYASDESGRYEVYITSLPDRAQTLTVSRQGGMAPAWSRDGRELFYHSPESPDGGYSMMTVGVRHSPALSLGQPTTLFRLPDGFVPLNPMRSYDLHPDGRRFLVGRRLETAPPPPITRLNLVHNWFAELERLAPTE